jgi:hypothetical protein
MWASLKDLLAAVAVAASGIMLGFGLAMVALFYSQPAKA